MEIKWNTDQKLHMPRQIPRQELFFSGAQTNVIRDSSQHPAVDHRDKGQPCPLISPVFAEPIERKAFKQMKYRQEQQREGCRQDDGHNHDSLDKVFVITIHSYRSFPASSSRRMCSSSS